jgi:hypothetical protein
LSVLCAVETVKLKSEVVFISKIRPQLVAQYLCLLITVLRVFENSVLSRIFGSKMDEVTGKCRQLGNEELNDLYCSPNIVRMMKSGRMRWAGHVVDMGKRRGPGAA